MSAFPRVLPVGDAAVTLELGDALDPSLCARVRAADEALRAAPFAGFREAVPTYRSLLVAYDPRATTCDDVRHALLQLAAQPEAPPRPGAHHVIPTRYGGDDGPDLDDVARARGLSSAEVVALHAATVYTCFMLGFMPGFAYLGLVPPSLEMPRHPTPRVRVPAGSLGIAGRQTGVYPAASPGGWQLLGRSSVRLFDPGGERPALILPGDTVTFAPSATLAEAPALRAPAPTVGSIAVEVLEPGLLTTVQDAGRFQQRRLGVSWAGAMDGPALAAANAALGNPSNSAGLECTLAGPTLRFVASTPFAIGGADLGALLHRNDLGAWPVPRGTAVLARAGSVLTFTGRRSGCRAYVAFAGGIDVPLVLGSRSTDLGTGFGGYAGRALRGGDLLSLGPRPRSAARDTPPVEPASGATCLRVVLGPQHEAFSVETVAHFLTQTFAVAATSDRVGCRLVGEPLARSGPAEMLSDGMLPGSIQIPPDGQPIVMAADAPTTGGYPKIATIVGADLPLLAQLVPGDGRVRFEPA